MPATLFVMPGSHPCATARLMLERKEIEFRQRWLLLPWTPLLVRAAGFRGGTVPALRIDGRRVQGSTRIARELDELRPDPPLRTDDPAVAEAERFGEEVLQPAARRIEVWQMRRNRRVVEDQLRDARVLEGARLPLPPGFAARVSRPTVAWYAGRIGADDTAVRAALGELPAWLDRLDAWIAGGVLGGAEPNAADFQIAPSVRMLMTTAELGAMIAPRPIGRLATGLLPEFPGRAAGVLPREWLPTR